MLVEPEGARGRGKRFSSTVTVASCRCCCRGGVVVAVETVCRKLQQVEIADAHVGDNVVEAKWEGRFWEHSSGRLGTATEIHLPVSKKEYVGVWWCCCFFSFFSFLLLDVVK